MVCRIVAHSPLAVNVGLLFPKLGQLLVRHLLLDAATVKAVSPAPRAATVIAAGSIKSLRAGTGLPNRLVGVVFAFAFHGVTSRS
jgi:hypothetical protein